MDDLRFDALTRALSSRRTALAGLLGGVAALIGLSRADEAGAHNIAGRCRKLKAPAARRACLRRARAHNRTHQCKPKLAAGFCGGRCRGSAVNNCGQRVDCPACPAGRHCLSNGTCARVCEHPESDADCGLGCSCRGHEIGNGYICAADRSFDCVTETPQFCTSTADCPFGYVCFEEWCDVPGGGVEARCVPVCVN